MTQKFGQFLSGNRHTVKSSDSTKAQKREGRRAQKVSDLQVERVPDLQVQSFPDLQVQNDRKATVLLAKSVRTEAPQDCRRPKQLDDTFDVESDGDADCDVVRDVDATRSDAGRRVALQSRRPSFGSVRSDVGRQAGGGVVRDRETGSSFRASLLSST
jgi:hypothetical protein